VNPDAAAFLVREIVRQIGALGPVAVLAAVRRAAI